jgi:AraC-like DNA-binding protein
VNLKFFILSLIFFVLVPRILLAASICQWTFLKSEVVTVLNHELADIRLDYYSSYEENGRALFRLIQIVEDRFAKKDGFVIYPQNGLRRVLLAVLVEPNEFDNISRVAQDVSIDTKVLQQKIYNEYGLSFNQLNVLIRTLAVHVDIVNLGTKHLELKDILNKWGLNQNVNFRESYRDLFGETPAKTFQKIKETSLREASF